MLLTFSARISGTDLGYLLHKNPARLHTFDLPFGQAHVFYPELADDHATAALLLDVDPVGLVRGSGLEQYVNDRPYAASSFLSVAMSRVLGTTMSGRSKERQELADAPVDWFARVAAVPCRGGEAIVHKLFTPLGYEIAATHHPLDERFPEWGEGPYYTIELRGHQRLQDLLTHLYVLLPVLDAEKHYWVGADEVEKLLRKGEGWLAAHPERETITARYLRYDRKLTRDALARLTDESAPDPDAEERAHVREETEIEAPLRLWEQRAGAVLVALRSTEAKSVLDLGCGEGKLLKQLLEDGAFERIAGLDVSWRSLESAARRLGLDRLPEAQRKRIELIHGSLMYRDRRLEGFDAATVVEVVEHLDPPRLAAFERVLFEHARPKAVVLTTPNADYNVHFPSLPSGQFRHKDHRFEWTRGEFLAWAAAICARFGYTVRIVAIGPEDPEVGSPTQMGVFVR